MTRVGYYYHSANVISLSLSQIYQIKQLLLYFIWLSDLQGWSWVEIPFQIFSHLLVFPIIFEISLLADLPRYKTTPTQCYLVWQKHIKCQSFPSKWGLILFLPKRRLQSFHLITIRNELIISNGIEFNTWHFKK